MSEPRYPTRVSDPDETARIPKDASSSVCSEAQRSALNATPSPIRTVPEASNTPCSMGPMESAAFMRPPTVAPLDWRAKRVTWASTCGRPPPAMVRL